MEEIKVKSNSEGRCPFCDSYNMEYGSLEFEGDLCYFPWTCRNCGHEGQEWYSMCFEGHNVITENGNTMIESSMVESEVE